MNAKDCWIVKWDGLTCATTIHEEFIETDDGISSTPSEIRSALWLLDGLGVEPLDERVRLIVSYRRQMMWLALAYEAALHQINALNDSPARFNKEIQDVLNSVIDTSDIKFDRQ